MISVIMPVYNVEKYVAESIQSVLDQTYSDFELNIVNDGSTDNTANVVRSFQDARIRLITQENKGVSVARNKGIEAALGDYIAFLDGDDLWCPDFLAKMIAKTAQVKTNVVYCGHFTLFENGREKHHEQPYPEGNILRDFLLDKIPINICTVLVNRKLLFDNNILFTAGCALGEDREFITKILCLAPAASVPTKLMKYRHRHGSAVHSPWSYKNLDHVSGLKRSYEFISRHYSGDDKETILKECRAHLHYRQYRCVLSAVRNGHFQLARELFGQYDIKNLSLSGRYKSFKHQLKLFLLKTGSETIWKML